MKIKMKDAGESPEFGPYLAGEEIDDTRAPAQTLRRLVERGMAEPAEGIEQRAENIKSMKQSKSA